MTETISRGIDGEWQGGDASRAGPVLDPATGKERARGAIIHATGDSLTFLPLFCRCFCPP
jgi:hypothetical protein